MARVTVEDCVLRVPNRFELVALAAQRSREISSGSPLSVDRDRDKNPVVALREIADETIELEMLRESLIQGLQKHAEVDLPDDDLEHYEGEGFELEASADDDRPKAPEGVSAADADAPVDADLDLASLARELAAQRDSFKNREGK